MFITCAATPSVSGVGGITLSGEIVVDSSSSFTSAVSSFGDVSSSTMIASELFKSTLPRCDGSTITDCKYYILDILRYECS